MTPASPPPTRAVFGHAPDGTPVELHTLATAGGIRVRVATWGGTIVSLEVPDRDGRPADVVLGHDAMAGYLRDGSYLGAVIGRYGNRIARGRFTIDGTEHHLATNDGPNHLHGGARGFDKVVWRAEPFARDGARGVVLAHTSPDGDQGYPGALDVRVTYTLTDAGELAVDYTATTDRATHVNLTQHSYFNLAGPASDSVLAHVLTVRAARYLPVDATLIPTGELRDVAGTPFDFREPTRVGARIDADDAQLRLGHGYDHTLVVDGAPGTLRPAARLEDPASGRVLEVSTTEPGVQLYTGNFLDEETPGKGGRRHRKRSALCLETQHFPDSPHRPAFPSTLLRPGAEYRSRTVFAFPTPA